MRASRQSWQTDPRLGARRPVLPGVRESGPTALEDQPRRAAPATNAASVLLRVAEGHSRVERGGDEDVSECVRSRMRERAARMLPQDGPETAQLDVPAANRANRRSDRHCGPFRRRAHPEAARLWHQKTTQKHPYPSKAHRRSYARRSAVERSNARIKDPATTDVARGWCRLMGLVPMSLFLACALVARNLAVADAFEERRDENARRLAAGLAPKTRRRRRKVIAELVGTASPR